MQFEVGMILEGKVTGITKFGAFVDLSNGKTGMVHISEVAPTFVKEISDHIKEGDVVKVKILRIGDDGKISLSIKQALPAPAAPQRRPSNSDDNRRRPPAVDWQKPKNEPTSFEDMMAKFKQTSDEKMSDLKRVTEAKRGGYSRRGGKDGMQK